MNDYRIIHERAVDADCLDQRILENRQHQRVDLVDWIFERVHLAPGDQVLELCSGTGNQTMRMMDLVGDKGHIVAVDLSDKALRQLNEKAGSEWRERLTTVTASMDELRSALEASGYGTLRFDLIFCAYGLYYSDRPLQVLEEGWTRLVEGGRIVVVGPFGPNNGQLFEILGRSNVVIPDYVRYTSQDFMEQAVLPFACRHFARSTMHVLVNPVEWKTPEDVMQYWRNTTFFDDQNAETVERNVRKHFEDQETFINEKWVMLVEMVGQRTQYRKP